jgi:hypothetical protein
VGSVSAFVRLGRKYNVICAVLLHQEAGSDQSTDDGLESRPGSEKHQLFSLADHDLAIRRGGLYRN